MKKNPVILIFQKNLVEGKVKTRLAKSIGNVKALEVYRYLLNHTHQQVAMLDTPALVFFENTVEGDFLNHRNFSGAVQSGEDLGERMKNAFQQAFDMGHHQVIIIGTDCLQLSSDIIKESLEALDSYEMVIGPAKDGGYYLLGLRKMYATLFEDKTWSSSTVFADTINEAKKLGLNPWVLKKLNDIDTYEDLGEEEKSIFHIG
jgi:rSAM/selenodomain-associated transferase 1